MLSWSGEGSPSTGVPAPRPWLVASGPLPDSLAAGQRLGCSEPGYEGSVSDSLFLGDSRDGQNLYDHSLMIAWATVDYMVFRSVVVRRRSQKGMVRRWPLNLPGSLEHYCHP